MPAIRRYSDGFKRRIPPWSGNGCFFLKKCILIDLTWHSNYSKSSASLWMGGYIRYACIKKTVPNFVVSNLRNMMHKINATKTALLISPSVNSANADWWLAWLTAINSHAQSRVYIYMTTSNIILRCTSSHIGVNT